MSSEENFNSKQTLTKALSSKVIQTLLVPTVEDLAEHIPAWQNLYKNAVSPNPFYSAEVLLPTISFEKDPLFQGVLLVYKEDELLGLFPLGVERLYRRFFLKGTTFWRPDHCYCTEPLLRKGFEKDACKELFAKIIDTKSLPAIFSCSLIPKDGFFIKAISELNNERSRKLITAPALFRAKYSSLQRVDESLPRKRKKELRRLNRRLEEQGTVGFLRVLKTQNLAFIEKFLVMENSGWKSDRKSSLLSTPESALFARDTFEQLDKSDLLEIYSLTLNEVPIAILTAFKGRDVLYLFKIAHSIELEQYSPGVLLIEKASNWWFNNKSYVEIDSCARQGHWMIESLWSERKEFTGFLLPLGGRMTNFLFKIAVLLACVKKSVHKIAARKKLFKGNERK
jgi:CelD/BcsL family acetyltransferase involved in cellulose biosynthesis